MKRIIGITTTLLLTATIAMGQSTEQYATESTQPRNCFAVSFFEATGYATEEENYCISPASAMWALAMSANGADGKTAKEIYAALGYPDAYRNREEFNNTQLAGIMALSDNEDAEINVANSIWIDNKIDVKEQFKSTSEKYYNAAVKSVTLSSAADEINSWCSKETNGKINKIIDHLSSTSQMAILNALWFKGRWVFPFTKEATRKKAFRKADGETVKVDMMKQSCYATYYEDEFMQATARKFEDSKYSMLFILPAEGVSTESAVERLNQIYDNDFAKGERYMFEFEMPKFKIEFGTDITPVFKELGIKRAFTGKADFSGISQTGLSIDNVIQKNCISIDETGVEAAGATAIMRCGAWPTPPEKKKHMKLDRPFIFAIRENINGTILFMGRVGNPAQ